MGLMQYFKRRGVHRGAAAQLYGAVVAQARQPRFYADLAVPDTVDGRFDMIVLHAMFVMRRLRDGGDEALMVGQALFDLMFRDMDQSLREMGVGDMSVGKHVKKMAKAFYGRAATYEAALDAGEAALATVLAENLYRHSTPTAAQTAAMACYLRDTAGALAVQPVSELIAGRVWFTAAKEGIHDGTPQGAPA